MKKFLFILTFLTLPFLAISQGIWSQTTNFPDSGRTMALTTTVGDTGYMFLGYKGSSFSYSTWMYDHSSNIWTQKAPFPGTWRTGSFVLALNGNIFIGCGSDQNGNVCYNDVWKYSPSTNTWSASTTYPANNRSNFAYYTYNNKGYVVFGRNLCTIAESNNFYEFDPIGETWTALTPYQFGSWRSRAAVYDDKVFFRNNGGALVLVYDLITNLWENNYPNVPDYFGNSTTENVFVLGNNLFEYTPSQIKYFHPPSRTWLNCDTSYNAIYHDNPAVMVFGDTAKFICGRLPNTNNFTNDIWNFYFGCTSTITADVTSVDSTYFGAITDLNNTSIVNPPNFAYAYHWQVDTLISGWFAGDTAFTPNAFGNYNIQLIADNGSCTDTFTKTIYVNPGMWSPKTTLPLEASARSRAIVFPIGNSAYIGFGGDGSQIFLKDFYKYDPGSHRLTTLREFPDSALLYASAITYNGKGYILGGNSGNSPYKSNKFYEYDPTTDTWTRLPDFPGLARYGASTFIINNELYLSLGGVSETYKYDFTIAVWNSVAPHPQLTFATHAFAYNGNGLIVSGDVLWQYNPVADIWNIYDTMNLPEVLTSVAATISGDELWIGYGKTSGTTLSSYRNSTAIYNLANRTIKTGPSNFANSNYYSARSEATFFELNGFVYSCFGKNPVGYDRTISRFEPGACPNIPYYIPQDFDESGLGIPITVVNSTISYLPPLSSSFQLVVDNVPTGLTTTDVFSSVNFRLCGEHKTQWVMNGVACTDTFTVYLTAHPVFNILSRAEMPLGTTNIRHTMNSFSLNGKGYMGMGNKYVEILSEAYKDWYEYDPGTNSWSIKSSLPSSASNTTGSSCFTNGSYGYITSGSNGCFPSAGCYLNDTWMYDPIIDSWSAKENWPAVGRYMSRADAYGDTALAGLGSYPFFMSDNIYKYSFSSDTWTTTNWPYGIGYDPTIFNFNGDFYAGYFPLGGAGNNHGLYRYNQSNGGWTQQLLKVGNLSASILNKVKNNDVYLFSYSNISKIDMVKKKVIPIQQMQIPGDTSIEFSAGFSIGDQVYFSLLNLDFNSPRLGNHFYQYDLAAPVCNLDSLILGSPNSLLKNSLQLNVSPNPASEKLNLQFSDPHKEIAVIQITDVTGKLLLSSTYNSSDPVIDIRKLTSGTYIVSLKNESGTILTSKKFIINR